MLYTEVCDVEFDKCCGNGDCIDGKCQCYVGWSSESNCCCKDTSKTGHIHILTAKNVHNCNFLYISELNILFQDEDTGSPLAQKTIKIIFNSEKSLAYITNDEGYITINGCDLKESIENGIAEVGGYCDVNFNHIISYSTAYSTIKSNDLILNLKKSAGKVVVQMYITHICSIYKK